MIGLVILIVALIGIYWALSSVFGIFTTVLGLIIPVMIWMLIGFLVGKMMRGKGYGPLGDAALGLAGGIVGSLLLGWLPIGGLFGAIITGILGAIIVIFAVRLFHDANFAR